MKPTLFVLFAVLASGCAFTEDHVHLAYTREAAPVRVSGAEAVTAKVSVRDVRNDTSRVSVKKNGFGAEMAAIRADNSLADLVRVAVEDELRARGFQLGEVAPMLIEVEVTRLWNDFKMGYFAGDARADFQLAVQVKNPQGAIVFVHNYSVTGAEENVQLASGTNAELALNRALEKGIRGLFADPAFLSAMVPPRS